MAQFYINLQGAEIASSEYGYYISKAEDFGKVYTEYTHNTKVDGDNQYGGAVNCSFPIRCEVGGVFNNYNINKLDMNGSRSIEAYHNTVYISVFRSIYNLQRAEIKSSSNDSGYIYAYYLTTPITEDNVTTKYTHISRVDEDTRYGSTIYGFPRRNTVGGYYTVNTYTENIIQYPGSRAVQSNRTTGSIFSNVSYNIHIL